MNKVTKIFIFTLFLYTLHTLNTSHLFCQLVSDFKVNDDTTDYSQFNAKVGIDGKGNFVIVWYDQRTNKNPRICGQIFSSNAERIGNNFQLNNDMFATNPAISVRENGSFGVCWNVIDVKLRIFDRLGNPLTNEIILEDSAGSICDIGNDVSGNFIVTWEQYYTSIYRNIFFQLLDSSGNKLGTIKQVNDDSTGNRHENPAIAIRKDGSFVITWDDTRPPAVVGGNDIYFQLFDSSGNKIGTNQKVNDDIVFFNFQHSPEITSLSNGEFIIAWNDDRLNNNGSEVYAQRFSKTGIRIGTNFRVSQSPTQNTKGFGSICSRLNDDFIIYWTEFQNFIGIPYFQRFRSDGSFIGNNFMVTNQSLSTEKFASDCRIFNDKIMSVWSDERNGPFDVYCNIRSFYNPDTTVNIINISFQIPSDFQLYQNYPNPFNNSTTINFDIVHRGNYKLEVYNLLGQRVQVLIDKFLQAGSYRISYSPDNLSSGIYKYVLYSENKRIVKRLLFMK